MHGYDRAERAWFIELSADDARLRCWLQRHGKTVERFAVQLELRLEGAWRGVVDAIGEGGVFQNLMKKLKEN